MYLIMFSVLPQLHRTPRDDQFGASYQQWLSSVEVRGCGRPHLLPCEQTSGCQRLTLDPHLITMDPSS